MAIFYFWRRINTSECPRVSIVTGPIRLMRNLLFFDVPSESRDIQNMTIKGGKWIAPLSSLFNEFVWSFFRREWEMHWLWQSCLTYYYYYYYCHTAGLLYIVDWNIVECQAMLKSSTIHLFRAISWFVPAGPQLDSIALLCSIFKALLPWVTKHCFRKHVLYVKPRIKVKVTPPSFFFSILGTCCAGHLRPEAVNVSLKPLLFITIILQVKDSMFWRRP